MHILAFFFGFGGSGAGANPDGTSRGELVLMWGFSTHALTPAAQYNTSFGWASTASPGPPPRGKGRHAGGGTAAGGGLLPGTPRPRGRNQPTVPRPRGRVRKPRPYGEVD